MRALSLWLPWASVTLERCQARGAPPESERLGLVIRTPYDEELVAALKAIRPTADRRWDPERGVWWVADDHEETVMHCLLDRFGTVLILGQDGESDYWVDRDGAVTEQKRLL